MLSQQSRSDFRVAVNGNTSEPKASKWNNFKNPLSGMDKYGDQRLELAVFVRDKVLSQLDIPWMIDGGTLLGAFRNGKFIMHDDDFDFALFFESDALSLLPVLLEKINQLLPAKYEARIVSTYCDKIEIFDPSHGSYLIDNPRYPRAPHHHVTVDLQPYQRIPGGDIYEALYRASPSRFAFRSQDVFPLGRIVLEGETFQAPGNVEAALKSLYGSISPTAKYNNNTGRYEDVGI